MEDDQNGRGPKWKATKMEDDLIGVGDCGWRVNQPGNSAIPRFRDFYKMINNKQLSSSVRLLFLQLVKQMT